MQFSVCTLLLSCLFSLSIVILTCFHVVFINSLFLFHCWILFPCMGIPPSICTFLLMDFFLVLDVAIAKSSFEHLRTSVFMNIRLHFSWVIARSGMAGSRSRSVFNSCRKLSYFSRVMVPFYVSISSEGDFQSHHFLTNAW